MVSATDEYPISQQQKNKTEQLIGHHSSEGQCGWLITLDHFYYERESNLS